MLNQKVQKPKIQVSEKLKAHLDKNSVNKNQTYEDIIWMLLRTNTLTKEQKLKAKLRYEMAL